MMVMMMPVMNLIGFKPWILLWTKLCAPRRRGCRKIPKEHFYLGDHYLLFLFNTDIDGQIMDDLELIFSQDLLMTFIIVAQVFANSPHVAVGAVCAPRIRSCKS